MLPSLLSEQLCSLRRGHERLAVSVIWTFESSQSFSVQDVWFGRTIIRSRHELHYQQAQVNAWGQTVCVFVCVMYVIVCVTMCARALACVSLLGMITRATNCTTSRRR